MAFTQKTQFSFSLLDELGTKASMVIYAAADPTKLISDLAADWETWAALIDAITGAQITGGTAQLVEVPSGDEKVMPAAGSRVEQTGVFDYPNGTSGRVFGEAVPGLDDSKIVDGTIDLSDADVAAFVAAMTTATANTAPTSNTFADLGALRDAFLSFRKRRKQLTRSSYELP